MALPDALAALLARGAKVIGCYETGAAIASGEDYAQAFTKDPGQVLALWEGLGDSQGRAKGRAIRRFRYEPGPAGFIVLDLDRHGDGPDGVKLFLDLVKGKGIIPPPFLADLDGGSFPCCVRTPSGGLHLYFRYVGGRQLKKTILCPGVELFQAGSPLTAPGSWKGGTEYLLHGSFDAAPWWPVSFDKLLPAPKVPEGRAGRLTLRAPWEREQGKHIPSLQALAEYVATDSGGVSGKNELCHKIALKAARADYPYTEGDVIAFLESYPGTAGHVQIRDAVHSAFRFRGKA